MINLTGEKVMSADNTNTDSGKNFKFQDCNIGNLFIGDASSVAGPHSDNVSRKSIDRVRQPISHMKETQTLCGIRDDVKLESTLILHCYGIPGSGKSQIIRKLATQFPYQETNLYIRWHIQCNDSGHDVKEELKKLAEELRLNSYLSTDECYRSVINQLDQNLAHALIDALKACNVPVLIVIEDPPEGSKELLKDLFRRLSSGGVSDAQKQCFHVYITSRGKCAVLSEEECSTINCHKMQNVEGFSEEEAISYLNEGKSNCDREAAVKVFKRFSGLPLGLQAAKGFCKSARIGYKIYLDLIKKSEYEIQEKERHAIFDEYGKDAQHIFNAIVMLFKREDLLHWKVLCCLSYLHYDRIPFKVIERCCYELRNTSVYEFAIVDKGQLISKLTEHGMCTETDKEEITFHEVVLNAFRLSPNPASDGQFKPLQKCVEILSCIVSKDMRNKDNSVRMYQLRRHLQSLLDNVEKEEHFFDDHNSILLKSLVSRLYETTAAVVLAESPSFGSISGKYFQEALQYIMQCMQCNIWGKSEAKCLVEGYKTSKQFEEIAKEVVKVSLVKAKQLPPSFIQDYVSKLKVYFDEKELDFLESKSKDFVNVREELQSSVINYESKLVEKLRNCGVFLPETSHQDVFYCEKVASILHSWSRVVLYADAKTDSEIEKCMWFSSLSYQISVECRIQCKVTLLSEKLATKGGLIPLLLTQKKSTENLEKAKRLCEKGLSQISDKPDVYEDGLLKEVDLFTHILFLRHLVRINCRLLAAGKVIDVAEADEKCKELLDLACKHLGSMSNGLICIIYCVKYYAVKQDFNEAMKCFDIYFGESQKSIRFNVQAWAMYNYARMVYRGNLLKNFEDALSKCKAILNSSNIIGADLRRRLQETVESLKMPQA